MRLTYKSTLTDHSPETVFAWHERPGALERLTPPWAHVDVLEKEGGIRDGARVVLRVHRGPTRFKWALRHKDFIPNRQFRDEQVSGPLKSWVHTHTFEPLDGGGTSLQDQIDVEAPLGAAGAAIGPALVKAELGRLFRFRYRRLFTDLAQHAKFAARPRMRIAITGASGLIGSNLADFLTTGGHHVIRLVRDSRSVGDDSIYWNPSAGELDRAALEGVDAVVHLGGTSIANGRWTSERKKAIMTSRVKGTELIARTLATMKNGPRILVSASATGFYGDRGGERLEESALAGKGFLAEVCRAWEGAVKPAERAGVRVALLRTGVALSPAGGALGQMLLPFKMGAGGRLGSGDQYLSWIDTDDLVAAIHHILMTDDLSGPINATAPHPVTNSTFTSSLGRVLGRPTFIPVPAIAVKAVFGELGQEALLWGQRVVPSKLTESGFQFFYEGVEDSMRFQLGRTD